MVYHGAVSLYRDYRPQAFADVVGQDHVVTTLEQAIKQKRLSHAYLFAGSRGTGKTSVARILAKEMLTQGMTDETLIRQIMKGVEEGSLVDLMEIDAASNRGIDDVRDLIEKIQFSPVVAAAKVYIVDEVHMLTKEAFNALLKTLEEPPSYAYFILATTELHKIPDTIQSRCQSFLFRRVRDEDIVRRLQYIADNEKITVERDALRLMAAHVHGGMRDAISLLDQLQSLGTVTADDVQSRLGATGHQQVEPVLSAIADGDASVIVETIRRLEENGVPLDTFARLVLEELRNRLHLAAEAKEPLGWFQQSLQAVLAALRDMRNAPVPGLVLESTLLQLCQPEEMISTPRAAAPKPQVIEVPKAAEKPAVKPEPATEAAPEAPASSAVFEAKPVTLETVREEWPNILKQTEPASVRMSLKDSFVKSVDNNTIVASFASTFHRDKVAGTDASRTVEAVLENIFKQKLRLECELGGIKEPVGASDDAVNLAEAAAEIF